MTSYDLSRECELRFELAAGESAWLRVERGSAECFGVPLLLNEEYVLEGPQNVVVFTWFGASVSLRGRDDGELETAYASSEIGSVISGVKLHNSLEALRDKSIDRRGPRVLICGPADSGKSALAVSLVAYACRLKRRVCFVDLDVGQNVLACPGCVSAGAIDLENLVVEARADSPFAGVNPLVFFHGSVVKQNNGFDDVVSKIARAATNRENTDLKMRQGGWIVNACGGQSVQNYSTIVRSCEIDTVVVVGEDRLYERMRKAFPDKRLVKLSRPSGAVSRSSEFRRLERSARIRRYFYGDSNLPLSPSELRLNMEELTFVRLKRPEDVAESALRPVGMEAPEASVKIFVEFRPDSSLKHSIIGVSAPNDECVALLHVVDVSESTLTVLSPSSEPLPFTRLVVGDIKWID